MSQITHAHIYEVILLAVSAVSSISAAGLFVLKMNDLHRVFKGDEDEATRYNAIEKARRQGFLFTATAIFFHAAITSVNNPADINTQVLNLLSVLIIVSVILCIDSWFTYRKRRRLPVLVKRGEERRIKHMVIIGGQRTTDPKE